jgi:hypothetical protein
MARHPGDILWVTFEADEAGALDDVVIARHDRKEFLQVKYAVEPDQVWSIENLTTQPGEGKKPLLRKWVEGWQQVRGVGMPYQLAVATNRVPDGAFRAVMTSDGHIASSVFDQQELSGIRLQIRNRSRAGSPENAGDS